MEKLPAWAWLLVGSGVGYLLAKQGGSVGYGLSFSVGAQAANGAPRGSGYLPIDQPQGSEPYQAVGTYNPTFSSGYPDLIDQNAQARIVRGGAMT